MTLSSPIFATPKQIKRKEKVTGPTISEDIVEGAVVTLQHLEALEAMIYAIRMSKMIMLILYKILLDLVIHQD